MYLCVWPSLECMAVMRKAGKLLWDRMTAGGGLTAPADTQKEGKIMSLWCWGTLQGCSVHPKFQEVWEGRSAVQHPHWWDSYVLPPWSSTWWGPGVNVALAGISCSLQDGVSAGWREKIPFAQDFSVCRRPARKLPELKWSHMSFSFGEGSSKWEHVCSDPGLRKCQSEALGKFLLIQAGRLPAAHRFPT